MKPMGRFMTFALTSALTAMFMHEEIHFGFYLIAGAALMICVMIGWGME
jgi:hypothetical protein